MGAWQVASELVKSQGKDKSRQSLSLVIGVGSGVFASVAAAGGLPSGGNIVAGNGSVHQNGNNMAIHQGSDKLAIDWQSFSIGKGNTVQFFQPGAASVALNRVLGSDVSVIQGALKANGKVFLVNPNGVLFTPSAQVDVGGLVASTLNLSTEDFLAGNYRFSGDSAASVVNQGNINAAQGGTIALIAAKIVNEGNITAHKGNVLLGAGRVVTLDLGGPVQLEVKEGALQALIENGGAIRADAGRILLTARAAETLASTVINNTGLIEARSLDIGENGLVTLMGDQGGVQVAGRIDVSSDTGKGGKIVVTGDRVAIKGGAELDATGAKGGGEIYVGGSWQGKDPAIKQASQTTIAAGAVLDASATDNGKGGTVVAWSDVKKPGSVTRVDGTLKATGGAKGGDGGKIETSGAKLAVSKAADASAKNGKGGLWLLDPDSVTVGPGNGGLTGGTNGTDATVGFNAIDTALAGGTDVAIKADNSIHWNGDYTPTSISGERTLTLQSGHNDVGTGRYVFGNIFLNGDIDASGAGNGNSLALIFNGKMALNTDVSLKSNGGNVVFAGVVDSDAVANNRQLRVDAGSGSIIFSDMVGGNSALGALYATTSGAGKTFINGAKVFTSGEQVYTGAVELGTSQFLNADFENGLVGWKTSIAQFFTGVTVVEGVVSPDDPTLPTTSPTNGNAPSVSPGDQGDMNYKPLTPVAAAGQGKDGGAALLLGTENNSNCLNAPAGCIMRGPSVVSEGTVSLAAGESVSFDYKPVAGGDTYDVFGYLLNVNTGEYQIILNETGNGTGAVNWQTHTATADRAGTYKFVFVSGSFDQTAGKQVGGSLYVDNIKTNTSGSKGLQGSSITFNGSLNSTDNNLAIKADDINFNGGAGSVTGNGSIALETNTPSKNIAVGGSTGDAPGSLELTGTDINALGDGFTSVKIGGTDMTGDISIIEATRINDNLILDAGTGNIHINDQLTVADAPGTGNDDNKPAPVLALQSNGGKIDQTAGGAIVADGLVLLGDGAVHDLDDAANDVNTIASDTGTVSFADVDDLTVGVVTIPDSQTPANPQGVPVAGMTQTGDLNLVADKLTVGQALLTQGDTSLSADEIDLAASVAGGGSLTLKQKTDGLDIHLGGSDDPEVTGPNDPLVLSDADLANIQDGFDKVTIGNDKTRNITVDDEGATFKDDLALIANGVLDLLGDLALKDPEGTDEDGATGKGLTLSVDAGKGATQATGATITADELALRGEGDFNLGNGGHDVGVIAADVGSLKFTGNGNLTVGVVDGTVGITSDEAVTLKTDHDLTLAKGITIENGPRDDVSQGQTRADDIITLEVAGKTTQSGDAGAKLDASGLVLLGGNYALGNTGNVIGDIASEAGKVQFNNSGDLKVGSLIATHADGTQTTITGVNNTGDVSIGTQGNLAINEGLATSGNVFLNVDGKTTQNAKGNIIADGLALNGGDFELRNNGNVVGDIASEAGKVAFNNTGNLKVGTLTETDGDGNVVKTTTGVNNTGDVSIGTVGDLAINEGLATSGNVFLNVDGKTTQDGNGNITADGLALNGGDFELRNNGNVVGDIASEAGKVAFNNTGNLKVGTLTETDGNGNVVKTTTGVNNTGDVSIGTVGDLAINEGLATSGNVFLNVDGKTTQNAKGNITADGLALNGGDFELRNKGNVVGDIASEAGKVAFNNTGNLKVGTLTETDGDGNLIKTTTGVNNTGDVSIGTEGNLAINEGLATSGNVFLNVDGKTTQDSNGNITADGLALNGGDFELRNNGNVVGDIASEAGKVAFNNTGNLKVGTLTETDGNGNVVKTTTGVNNTGDVSIGTVGDLAINEGLATSGNVFLNVDGKTTQNAKGNITADGLALNGGDFELRNKGNVVGDIASEAGKVAFNNTGNLKVGTLTETDGNGNLVKTTTGVNNTGDVSIGTAGDLAINEGLATSGNVFLNVDGKTSQNAKGNITADGLALNGGDFELRNKGNVVGDIASKAGKVAFNNTGDLKVGTLTETDGNGNLVKTTTGVNNTGDVSIGTQGNLAINEALGTSGNVFLNVDGKTTQNAKGNITADGLALNGGDFELRNNGNVVGDIASKAGKVAFNNTGNLKVGTLTETDGNGNLIKTTTGVNNTGDVSIGTQGNLAINEALATSGNVFLNIDGKTTQNAKGNITADGLALKGGNFDLRNASNWVGDIASRAKDVSFVNRSDVTVGRLTETALDGTQLDQIVGIGNTGKVQVVTTTGNITLAENVSTTSNASDAIVLNAGQSASAGVAAGGDVKAGAGVTVSTGAGGRAVIYTGSLAGSTRVVDVVGSGSGNFRYNSDEQQSNFGRALGSTGVHAVYREQPVLVVSTNGSTTQTKPFDGQTTFNGGGIAGYDANGLWNGDTKQMLGNPLYSVGTQGPGSHLINIGGMADLGYLIVSNPANANLTVTPSVDYDAVRQSVADATRVGAQVTSPHAPELNPAQPKPADWSDYGVDDGGLLLVDQGGNRANGAGNGDGDSAAQAESADSERELAGNVCADGGVSGGSACAAYPPQTVFVVRGGVRLPSLAMRP
jgi:filamentous hemagglutinin family protein